MNKINLNIVKARISAPKRDKDFMPLVLFRGNLTIARIQSLWNYMLAMKDAEIDTITKAYQISAESHSLNHLCGLHRPASRSALVSFCSRMLSAPEMESSGKELLDYIHFLKQSPTHPFWTQTLAPISRYGQWSTRAWRKPGKKKRKTTKGRYRGIQPLRRVGSNN